MDSHREEEKTTTRGGKLHFRLREEAAKETGVCVVHVLRHSISSRLPSPMCESTGVPLRQKSLGSTKLTDPLFSQTGDFLSGYGAFSFDFFLAWQKPNVSVPASAFSPPEVLGPMIFRKLGDSPTRKEDTTSNPLHTCNCTLTSLCTLHSLKYRGVIYLIKYLYV